MTYNFVHEIHILFKHLKLIQIGIYINNKTGNPS